MIFVLTSTLTTEKYVMAGTSAFQLSRLIKHPRGHSKHKGKKKKNPECPPKQQKEYIIYQNSKISVGAISSNR